jgi:hypothetical protein
MASADFLRAAERLLKSLTADLPWIVLFDPVALGRIADPVTLAAAFHLPGPHSLQGCAAVALAPGGACLVSEDAADWLAGRPAPPAASDASLFAAQAGRIAALHSEAPICLGLGRCDDGTGVALMVNVAGEAQAVAEAALDQPPDTSGYELLGACGVSYGGTARRGKFHVACFENLLAAHLLNGLLAGFSRTFNCNRFFLAGARIDAAVGAGLLQAGAARVAAARQAVHHELLGLAQAARRGALHMTCRPPAPAPAEPMGDLVPLGLLLRALRRVGSDPPTQAAALLLVRHLQRHAKAGLWPFESGRLPTAIDSGLVLLGLDDAEAVAGLERFATPQGGVLPQLFSPDGGEGVMRAEPATRHWCQPDFATTALAVHLRRRHGLDASAGAAWLQARFACRGSLFIANPFLLDWLLALALAEGGPELTAARAALAQEVAAAMDGGHGFGGFDPVLSTSCAILALAALGRRGRLLRCAQIALANLALRPAPPATPVPFCSSLALARSGPALHHAVMVRVSNGWHALTLYEDTFRMIETALRALALAEPADPSVCDLPSAAERAACHARYRCATVVEYVARHALPPYVEDLP